MVNIDTNRCVGCGTCVSDCISHALHIQDGKAVCETSCFLCGHCVAICPHGAVSIETYSDPVIEFDKDTFSIPTDAMINTIKMRRSIRNFQDRPVSMEDLHTLIDGAAHMPTAVNRQACRFVFVQDSFDAFKQLIWDELEVQYNTGTLEVLPSETMDSFMAMRSCTDAPAYQRDFLFRNAPALLCIQAPDPLDGGLAAAAIEMVGSTIGVGVLYNGYVRRIIEALPQAQAYLDMDLQEKPLVACMLVGYPAVSYKRTAPRRNPSVVLR